MPKVEQVAAAELVLDYTIYPRHSVDDQHVKDLVRSLAAGEVLPPIVAERKSRRVVDGFHRVLAVLSAGGDGLISVEWRDYPDEKSLLEDAVRRNARHGKKLAPWDRARCILLAENLQLEPERLANALCVPVEVLQEIRARKVAYDGAGSPVEIKPALRHLAGKRLTDQQVEANRRLGGNRAAFYISQVRLLLEGGVIDPEDAELARRLIALHDLLSAWLPRLHRFAQRGSRHTERFLRP